MFSDALGVFRRIMETRGGDDLAVLARYRAAWCHYNVRNEKAALAEFEDIAKRYPHSGIAEDIAYWLGEYYYSHGMSKDAERQFTLFLEKFPSGELAEYAQFHLALLAEDALEHEKALREFLELGRRYPAGRLAPEARLRAAGLLVKMSRPDEAIRLYEAVVSEFPKTDFAFLAHRKMAAVLKDERRYDEAAGNLKKGMALGRPEEAAELHYGLGECFEEKGDLPRAKEEYLSIPRLYPKDKFWPIRALLAAAKASEKLGQREEAERIYERLAGGDVEESKFARERLEAIRGKQTTDYKLPSTKK
jgi:TolA-binding protein